LNLAGTWPEISHNADYVNCAARRMPGLGGRSAFSSKAAASAGENQRVLIGQHDGGELFGIEIIEKRHLLVGISRTRFYPTGHAEPEQIG